MTDHILVSTYQQLEETREELACKGYKALAVQGAADAILERYGRPDTPEETEILYMDHYDRQAMYNIILATHKELGAASDRPLSDYLKYRALEADFRQFMMGIGEWWRPEPAIGA